MENGSEMARLNGGPGAGTAGLPGGHGSGVGTFGVSRVLGLVGAGCLDLGECRRGLIGLLHPGGGRCPGCGEPVGEHQLDSWHGLKRLRCGRCGRFFTAASGTVLSGCKLDWRVVFLIAAFLALGLEVKVIARTLGVSEETVRLWRGRFDG